MALRETDDDLLALRNLQSDADALSRRFAAGARAARQASAWDSDRAVRAVIDDNGRVAGIEVAEDWQRRIEVADFGRAVVAAADEAGRRWVEAWAEGALSSSLPTDDGKDDVGAASAGGVDPSDAGAMQFSRDLFYVLHDATARLDTLTAEIESRAHQTVTQDDPEHRVTVSVSAGAVTMVRCDERWLASAGEGEIARAVTEAVRAGYARADEPGPVASGWPFHELGQMTADPVALLSNLGLPVPAHLHRQV